MSGVSRRILRLAFRVRWVKHKLTAIMRGPTGVKVEHKRENPICLASEGIFVAFVIVARAIEGEMTFEGEQTQQQMPVEIGL